MAPSSRELQKEVSSLTSKVEGDLSELARRQQRAQENGGHWNEVQVVLARLQQHRQQIRLRSSAKNLDKAVQGKLAATRAKIEEAVRKARDLEKKSKDGSPQQPSSPATSAVSSPAGPPPPSLDSASYMRRSSSSMSSIDASASAEAEVTGMEEVKVLTEQLITDASGGEVMSEFVCQICQTHVVGCQPKLTSCSHLFCGDCIGKWFAVQPGCQSWAGRAKGAGAVPCPVCKEPLRADKDLHPVCKGGQGGSAFLWQMLSATRIVCRNNPKCCKEGRCDWEGDYGSYQEHIRHCTNKPSREAAPTCTSPCAGSAEASEASADEASASVAVSHDADRQVLAKTTYDTSCTASSFGDCEATMSETESEADDAAPLPTRNNETESMIGDGSSELAVAAPVAAVNTSEVLSVASAQEPDLYSLIAQLVELKTSAVPEQAEQPPASPPACMSLEASPSPRTSSETQAPQEQLAASPGSKIGGGSKKPAATAKAAKSKRPQEAFAASQLKAHAAELKAMQAQARVAQAAQAAYAAQWQAAWQMQAAQAMQWQQNGMAYAGQMAQWQMAQNQAAQAAWAMQTARR
jgi:hypothetical protein